MGRNDTWPQRHRSMVQGARVLFTKLRRSGSRAKHLACAASYVPRPVVVGAVYDVCRPGAAGPQHVVWPTMRVRRSTRGTSARARGVEGLAGEDPDEASRRPQSARPARQRALTGLTLGGPAANAHVQLSARAAGLACTGPQPALEFTRVRKRAQDSRLKLCQPGVRAGPCAAAATCASPG
jgi:hypothetical protein